MTLQSSSDCIHSTYNLAWRIANFVRFFEWKGSRRKSFDPNDFNEHICTAISKAAHSPTSHIHTCHIVPPIFMNYDLIFQGKQGLGLALIIFLLVGVFQQLLGYKHSMQCLYEVASVIWQDILWVLFFFSGKAKPWRGTHCRPWIGIDNFSACWSFRSRHCTNIPISKLYFLTYNTDLLYFLK